MKKVLVIEDDRVVARIYQAKLQAIGLEVDTAQDGEEGVKRTAQNAPDLVILDLGLPKLNGVEVLKRIRANESSRNTPVVVMSNSYVTELVQSAWKAGATKCLTKTSCTPAQLVEIVQGIFAKSTPTPAPSAAPSAQSSAASADLKEANSQAELRESFLKEAPNWVGDLRQKFQSFTRGGAQSVGQLAELYRSVHSFTGNAGIAGFVEVGNLSAAIEALLKELHEQPKKLGPSPIRSMALAIDSLAERLKTAAVTNADQDKAPLALVVDDDRISRTLLGAALNRANIRCIVFAQPDVALKCCEENSFDIVFTDVRMAGLSGFDFCAQLRKLPNHSETPVIFVTSADDFESRAQSKLSGGNDLIVKPFLMSELAVKALTYLKPASGIQP